MRAKLLILTAGVVQNGRASRRRLFGQGSEEDRFNLSKACH
jgi:hypothetical protein